MRSGKKYKRCCADAQFKQQAEVIDDVIQSIVQAAEMNPTLSLDELNLITANKMAALNNAPNADFCGLTATQMTNWLYAPMSELQLVSINTPQNIQTSPVMSYLELILEAAMKQDGKIKATATGNLPVKLVKQACALLPSFAVDQHATHISISEFTGSNENKFNALHYTRILAEISGIIFLKKGHFHIKKTAQKKYQNHGIAAFFIPMLEAACTKYNWGYLDGWPYDINLNIFWVFMLWRIQTHKSFETMVNEVKAAFPALLQQMPSDEYSSQGDHLSSLIGSRFMERFLQYWGFVTIDPRRFLNSKKGSRVVKVLPLLNQSFNFDF